MVMTAIGLKIAKIAGGAVMGELLDRVGKRILNNTLDEVSNRAVGALASLGGTVSGAILSKKKVDPGEKTPSEAVAERIKTVLASEMDSMGITMVSNTELTALRAVALAADGKGDLAAALAAWKATLTLAETVAGTPNSGSSEVQSGVVPEPPAIETMKS